MLENNSLYNLDLERGVLNSIIFDGKLFEEVSAILKAKDFYMPFYQEVFRVMERLTQKDMPIDEIFVKEELEKVQKYDEEKFLELISAIPVETITSYSKEIKDKAIKRELIHFSNEIKKEVLENVDAKAIEAVEDIQVKLFDIATQSDGGDFRDALEVTSATLEWIKIQQKKQNKLVTGLDTGFADLNKKTSGFGEGDLIILAARPSMGKTAFALNIATNVLNHDKGVAIFSLEMGAEQLMLRMLSSVSNLPLQSIRTGNLDEREWSELSQYVDMLASKKLFIDDNGNATIHSVRAKLRKLKATHPELSLAIIDYLQLMQGSNSERHLAVAEISRGLKMLARELQIPIIALSQLNRSLESRPDRRPMMSDIRESGAIEQDADLIMFVYRDDVYKLRDARQKAKEQEAKGEKATIDFQEKPIEEAEIIIGKQRNGPIGTVELQFNKAYTRFESKAIAVEEYSIKETEMVDNTPVDSPII